MCEPTSNAEAVRVDVAHERGNGKEATNVSSTVEYWQSALQEFCKNSPTPPPPPPQHAYVANPLTATPPAYGLWSGQIPPPLLTPYGPMPFFGGFFPGAYPIHPATTVPTVSLPAVKPEMHEDGEKGTQRNDLQTPKRPCMSAEEDANVAAASAATTHTLRSLAVPSIASPESTSGIDRTVMASMGMCTGEETSWPKIDDELNPSVVRDDRELKKERRKQSNRESARRSRLRKQRECEALQKQVQDISALNQCLEQEITQLKQRLAEVERENEQLKETWSAH